MNLLTNVPKMYIWITIGVFIVTVVAIVTSFFGSTQSTDTSNLTPNNPQVEKLDIDDVKEISVHSGLDIQCPNLQGVSQNGYAYSVLLTNESQVIERLGCGSGEPEIFAEAIAQDLERSGAFKMMSTEEVLEKMIFKFYIPNGE